jgi:hypothetical protein
MRRVMATLENPRLSQRKVTEIKRDGRQLFQFDVAMNYGQGVATDRYVFDSGRGFALVFVERALLPVGRRRSQDPHALRGH